MSAFWTIWDGLKPSSVSSAITSSSSSMSFSRERKSKFAITDSSVFMRTSSAMLPEDLAPGSQRCCRLLSGSRRVVSAPLARFWLLSPSWSPCRPSSDRTRLLRTSMMVSKHQNTFIIATSITISLISPV